MKIKRETKVSKPEPSRNLAQARGEAEIHTKPCQSQVAMQELPDFRALTTQLFVFLPLTKVPAVKYMIAGPPAVLYHFIHYLNKKKP